MITLIMGIILVGLGVYSIYITSPIKIKKEKIENLEKEIEGINLISFRDFLVSKGRDWFKKNKKIIKRIMFKKY